MEPKPQDVVVSANKAAKPAKSAHDPVVTDLNMTIGNMIISGMSKAQVARELGITSATVSHHVKRLRTLTESSMRGEIDDPVNNQRARLINRLKATDRVIGYALRPGIFKRSIDYLKVAKDVAIAVNKGLGVLVDKTEVSGQVDLLAQRRDDMRARLDACRQFGLNPVDELPAIMAEVVEDKVDVSRADSPAPEPEAQPIKAETVDNQPTIKPQVAPECAPASTGKAPAKPERQTLSKSKW